MMYKLLYTKYYNNYTITLYDVDEPENSKELIQTTQEVSAGLVLKKFIDKLDPKLWHVICTTKSLFSERYLITPTEELWEMFKRQVGLL